MKRSSSIHGSILALAASVGLAFSHASPAELPPHPETVPVPGGPFIAGSSEKEREMAYQLDEMAYGHSITRKQGWYDGERKRQEIRVAGFAIMATPVTQAQYARFVNATGHRAPNVDRTTWESYGLIHPWPRTRPYAWEDGQPPADKADHPVVMVSHGDAVAYARWLSDQTGQNWRLPTELEWEKAARGTDGRYFPWGNAFDADRLNSHDKGPFATTPVGSYPSGASPYGALDMAGQVYEWTATPVGPDHYRVKGGSWDDKGCGVCRPAARHPRPHDIKHILVGFRLVRPLDGDPP